MNDAQNECVYDEQGFVKQYSEKNKAPLTIPKNSEGERPSRKQIVTFLLDLIEKEEMLY